MLSKYKEDKTQSETISGALRFKGVMEHSLTFERDIHLKKGSKKGVTKRILLQGMMKKIPYA